MAIAEGVEDLYVARWGDPSWRARFDDGALAIEILSWDKAVTTEGVALYATLGASTSLSTRTDAHRVEFILGLSEPRDEVASPLAGLGLYAAQHDVALDHGHTVPSDEPLWPGAAMHAFLVVRPLPDFLDPLVFPEGLHVEFLEAIPIFESEIAYKAQKGVERLLADWEAAQTAFWDPDREPNP